MYFHYFLYVSYLFIIYFRVVNVSFRVRSCAPQLKPANINEYNSCSNLKAACFQEEQAKVITLTYFSTTS